MQIQASESYKAGGVHLDDGFMVHVVGDLQRGDVAPGREGFLVAPEGAHAEAAAPPAAQLAPSPTAQDFAVTEIAGSTQGRPLVALCREPSGAVHSSDSPRRKSVHGGSSHQPLQHEAALSQESHEPPEKSPFAPQQRTLPAVPAEALPSTPGPESM